MHRRKFLKGSLATGLGAVGASALPYSASLIGSGSSAISPYDLRCEHRSNPLGVDSRVPRLSWKLEGKDGARHQLQSAYRILVASSESLLDAGLSNLWDSGRVESSQQLHVEYRGIPLTSGQRCFWRVEVWDMEGRTASSGYTTWWEMGLLSSSDWKGTWISDGKPMPEGDADHYEDDPAPLLRRTFQIERPVRKARLYATSLGYNEMRLNGRMISDEVLAPAWTHTSERVFYSCHDVTDQLIQGQNVIGAMLGNGWRNPLPLRMWGRINIREHLPVGRPALLCQLELTYEDGSTESVASSADWRVTEGPVIQNSVYLGETYDARREVPGWDGPAFDDVGWHPAAETGVADLETKLQASPIPPIRATREVRAVSVTEVSEGVHIVDLGQNFAGWARLRVQGPAGTTVQMRMGELLYEDGTLNPMTAVAGQIKRLKEDGESVGGQGAPEIAWQANTYTLKGGEEEVYTPRFTFHGFRYVELTGFPGDPDLSTITGLRLNTDVAHAGSFQCSNEAFNRIQAMVEWTFLSNLFSVQSDCPAREKFQYGGDIVASSEMALFGYDVSAFYAKVVDDFRDAAIDGWFTETAPFVGIQAANYADGAGPIGWGLAHPLLMAQLYQFYGDRRVLEEHFEHARRWVDLLEAASDGLIIDRCIGDHESLDPKPIALVATAQFHQAASLVAGFAKVLGESEHEATYSALADRIRAAFVSRFLQPGTGRFDSATQAAQATALTMGLVPTGETEAAVQRMVDAVTVDHDGHIAAGIFGTKYLLNMLTETGNADVAYAMVDQPDYPGWRHMMANGATTLWETWAQSDNVYSQNHPMFGSVSEWFFKCLGGLSADVDAKGFDRFTIAPFVGAGMEWAETHYDSVRGRISSSWRVNNGQLTMTVSIPPNTMAKVRVPTSDPTTVQEGGEVIGHSEMELGSGDYTFTAAAP